MSGLGEWLDEVEERDLAATSIRRWYDAERLIDLRFSNDDAEFIAHAREDVPRLVGILRRALDRDNLAREMFIADRPGVRDAARRWDELMELPFVYSNFRRLADAVIAFIEGTETGK